MGFATSKYHGISTVPGVIPRLDLEPTPQDHQNLVWAPDCDSKKGPVRSGDERRDQDSDLELGLYQSTMGVRPSSWLVWLAARRLPHLLDSITGWLALPSCRALLTGSHLSSSKRSCTHQGSRSRTRTGPTCSGDSAQQGRVGCRSVSAAAGTSLERPENRPRVGNKCGSRH